MKTFKEYITLITIITIMTACSVYWYYENPIPFLLFFMLVVMISGASLDEGNKANYKEKQDNGEYF